MAISFLARHGLARPAIALVAAAVITSACAGSDEPNTLTLLTHDSFAISEATLESFTEQSGVGVEVLQAGDAGSVLSQAILTKDNPIADVIFGVDNTFLSRAVEEQITVPYESPALAGVIDTVQRDPSARFTPIDFGDVCLQYDISEVGTSDPSGFFGNPDFGSELVVQDPSTSSPGLAFLLATIAAFPNSWQDYWAALREAGVLVVPGWEEAYYGEFSGASDGDRPIVVSYASSPVAEVVFAVDPIDAPSTAIVEESCFRQVEYAGILDGTDSPEAARQFVDFMLSEEFQEDIPLNMFVFPANGNAVLPDVFQAHATVAETPLTLDPQAIADNRERWIEEWTEIVLR